MFGDGVQQQKSQIPQLLGGLRLKDEIARSQFLHLVDVLRFFVSPVMGLNGWVVFPFKGGYIQTLGGFNSIIFFLPLWK